MPRGLRQFISIFLWAALIFSAPGLPAYQAMAQGLRGGKPKAGSAPLRIKPTDVSIPLNLPLSRGQVKPGANPQAIKAAAATAAEALAALAPVTRSPAGANDGSQPFLPGVLNWLKLSEPRLQNLVKPGNLDVEVKAPAAAPFQPDLFSSETSPASIAAPVANSGSGLIAPASAQAKPKQSFQIREGYFGFNAAVAPQTGLRGAIDRVFAFFGFRALVRSERRSARPVRHDWSAAQIVEDLAGKLKLSQEAVLAEVQRYAGLDENSAVKDWWRVWDAVYASTRELIYNSADHHKYEAWPQLWEIHKHLAKLLIRFP